MNKQGLFAEKIQDKDFCLYYEREKFIEDFLNRIDEEMKLKGISRFELSKRMKCSPTNIDQIMSRTKRLTFEITIDIAFHLGFHLQLIIIPK